MQISFFKRERLRIMGIYLIIILVFLRFVLWPLSSSVEDKTNLLDEYLETYRTMAMLVQRKKSGDDTIDKSDTGQKKKLIASLYPKDSRISEIQPETIRAVLEIAEMNDLSVINFQLPDATISKDLSEVSIVIRLSGMPKAIINLLKEINQMEKLTDVRILQLIKSNQLTLILTLTRYRIES